MLTLLMSEEIEKTIPEKNPNDTLINRSKIRDTNLGIQPYNFFSYEQFGVSPNYFDSCDEISKGTCWSWCYQKVWGVFDNIADRSKHRPGDGEVFMQVLRKFDEGHASFYIMLCLAKLKGLLTDDKINEAIPFWSKYFEQWGPWFKIHYPKYFLPRIDKR